ncbi:MAG TPA: chloride channel protein, partial [Balneolales bacterium]|nr:chloride channel protein [Balneolales bacterium]
AVLSYSIFDALTGAEFTPYHFSFLPALTFTHFLESICIGLIGGLAATFFIYVFRAIENISEHIKNHTILLAVMGGLSIGIIPTLFPSGFPITPLFWSEYQIKDVITNQGYLANHYGIILAVGLLVLLALAKMISVGCTLHSGFKGGFIFPMFFIGASLGLAVSLISHQTIPAPLSMLCMMAAINVAVTKTPVSTSILLTTLSGMAMLPVIAAASLTSFFLTTNVALIRTQQHRRVRNPEVSAAFTRPQ